MLGINGVVVFKVDWPATTTTADQSQSASEAVIQRIVISWLWFLKNLSSLLRFEDILPYAFVSDHTLYIHQARNHIFPTLPSKYGIFFPLLGDAKI